jgi:hypothetical protein
MEEVVGYEDVLNDMSEELEDESVRSETYRNMAIGVMDQIVQNTVTAHRTMRDNERAVSGHFGVAGNETTN